MLSPLKLEKIAVAVFLILVGIRGLFQAVYSDKIEHVAEVNLPEEERFVPATLAMKVITGIACLLGVAAGIFVLVKTFL